MERCGLQGFLINFVIISLRLRLHTIVNFIGISADAVATHLRALFSLNEPLISGSGQNLVTPKHNGLIECGVNAGIKRYRRLLRAGHRRYR